MPKILLSFLFLTTWALSGLSAQPYEFKQTLDADHFKHDGMVTGVAMSPDGKHLLSGEEKNIWVWDRASGQKLRKIGELVYGVAGLAYSPDGTKLAVEDRC